MMETEVPEYSPTGRSAAVSNYFECDEFSDVENSLCAMKLCLANVKKNPGLWKWIIVSCHNALQGTCVCILTQTDGTGPFCDNNTEKLKQKLYGEDRNGRYIDDPDKKWPDPYLEPLQGLLRRLPGNLSVELPEKNAEEYNYELAGDLRRLCQYRDRLIHFPPSSWSLELGGLPRILERAIDHVEKIVNSGEWKRFNRFAETQVLQIVQEIRPMIVSLFMEAGKTHVPDQ